MNSVGFNILFIILLIVAICLMFSIFRSYNQETIRSRTDNREYAVQDLDDKEMAADILGIVRSRIFLLKNYLEQNIDKYPEFRPYIEQFCNRIVKTKFTENSPSSKYTSYTVNKGDEITLCLRSKKTGRLHDINLIMYVAIHEISHVACPEIEHTELFTKIFKFLLGISIELGIYEMDDYYNNPRYYCGMTIRENLFR